MHPAHLIAHTGRFSLRCIPHIGRFSLCRPGAPTSGCSSGFLGANNALIAICLRDAGLAVPRCGSSSWVVHSGGLGNDAGRRLIDAAGAVDVSGLVFGTRVESGGADRHERERSGLSWEVGILAN